VLRVAMVSEHASPLAVLGGVDAGGQNVYVAAVAQELARRGVEVVVHTRRDDPSVPRRVQMAPNVWVEHVEAGPPEPIPNAIDTLLPFMDEFANELARAWERRRPDVVHSHFWMSGRASLAAAQPLEIPIVHTFHALGVVKKRYQGAKDTSPPQRAAEEVRILRRADRVVATCSDEMFELARLGGDMTKIRVVPCGVNLRNFRPDGPAEPRTPGLRRLVVVSRLVERKGVGNVVAALRELPDTELVIAGGAPRERLAEDPEAARLMRIARDAGVQDRVVFHGRLERHEVPPLLRSADVVVSVPWYEPFGIVPLEAMACGVPVVAAAVGGLIDTVVDGVTGLHVPPRRTDAIVAAVRTLFADPRLRASLGAAGARRVRQLYTWERVADTLLEVYGDLMPARAVAGEQWA
jgi:D-inositol-3-phosphate glycosyltransferase